MLRDVSTLIAATLIATTLIAMSRRPVALLRELGTDFRVKATRSARERWDRVVRWWLLRRVRKLVADQGIQTPTIEEPRFGNTGPFYGDFAQYRNDIMLGGVSPTFAVFSPNVLRRPEQWSTQELRVWLAEHKDDG